MLGAGDSDCSPNFRATDKPQMLGLILGYKQSPSSCVTIRHRMSALCESRCKLTGPVWVAAAGSNFNP